MSVVEEFVCLDHVEVMASGQWFAIMADRYNVDPYLESSGAESKYHRERRLEECAVASKAIARGVQQIDREVVDGAYSAISRLRRVMEGLRRELVTPVHRGNAESAERLAVLERDLTTTVTLCNILTKKYKASSRQVSAWPEHLKKLLEEAENGNRHQAERAERDDDFFGGCQRSIVRNGRRSR